MAQIVSRGCGSVKAGLCDKNVALMSCQLGNPRRVKGARAATPRLGTTERTSMDLPQTCHSVLLGALRAGLATFLFWAASYPGVCLARPSDPCEEGRELFARREWRAAQERLWRCVAAGTQTKERA